MWINVTKVNGTKDTYKAKVTMKISANASGKKGTKTSSTEFTLRKNNDSWIVVDLE